MFQLGEVVRELRQPVAAEVQELEKLAKTHEGWNGGYLVVGDVYLVQEAHDPVQVTREFCQLVSAEVYRLDFGLKCVFYGLQGHLCDSLPCEVEGLTGLHGELVRDGRHGGGHRGDVAAGLLGQVQQLVLLQAGAEILHEADSAASQDVPSNGLHGIALQLNGLQMRKNSWTLTVSINDGL